MRSRSSRRHLPLIGILLASSLGPALVARAQDEPSETTTDQLPSYAQQEREAAREAARGSAPPGAVAPSDVQQQEGATAGEYGEAPPPPEEGTPEQEVPPSQAERPGVKFDDFYGALSPYGTWVETPEYGYVFVPNSQNEAKDWRPYLYGQWVWTRYGWTWVSDEPFGWATYHYGRWTWLENVGWAWVPGYTWGPAWVAWRYGQQAIGWAPLYPGFVSVGVGFPIYWDAWTFCPPAFFFGFSIGYWAYPYAYGPYWYGATTFAPNWVDSRGTVYAGPPRNFVAHEAGHPIPVSRIETPKTPMKPVPSGARTLPGGAPETVRIFRPDQPGAMRPSFARNVEVPTNRIAPSGVGSGLAPAGPRVAELGPIMVPGIRTSPGPAEAGRIAAPGLAGRAGEAGRITMPQAPQLPEAGRMTMPEGAAPPVIPPEIAGREMQAPPTTMRPPAMEAPPSVSPPTVTRPPSISAPSVSPPSHVSPPPSLSPAPHMAPPSVSPAPHVSPPPSMSPPHMAPSMPSAPHMPPSMPSAPHMAPAPHGR